MSEQTELLPCPFCWGVEFGVEFYNHEKGTSPTVECLDCGVVNTLDEWNTRDTRQQAEAVGAAYEAATELMGEYHWNRYKTPEEGGELSRPAVFSSHTHQHVTEALRALTPSDATAALEARDARVWDAAIEAVDVDMVEQAISDRSSETNSHRIIAEYVVECIRALQKGTPDAL